MGANLEKAVKEEESKRGGPENMPPLISDEALQSLPKPSWVDVDPFVKHRDSLPSARMVALVTSGLSIAGALVMIRWNRQAGRVVDKHLKAIEHAKQKGLPPPKVPEASTFEAAGLGLKALALGTFLSTTTFVAAGSWVVHLMGVQTAKQFALKMQSAMGGARKSVEDTVKGPTEAIVGGKLEGVDGEAGDDDEGFNPLIALFGKELVVKDGEIQAKVDQSNNSSGNDGVDPGDE
eukprot:CAMPEP_0197536566 /NCGR_PEP_ID=MMETSP1318-20131121/54231_1 /TAXON_ID=552666 /ORGANISM="Partenskyella glossopodia, Strain RCC365" /LENGTH=234 /DNA_ID=CAMNT_0043094487 /DNA_START=93 /DNA_END=795 /DNA_ORIENTATION=-